MLGDGAMAWVALGLAAQVVFSARFVVQWLASERAGASVVPTAFWYLSLSGSALLLVYAIHRRDPVFILGQGMGFLIYLRNLHLLRRQARVFRSESLSPAQAREPARPRGERDLVGASGHGDR